MCSSNKCKSNKYNKMINNTVIKINKAKTLLKQISCDCKCESDST